MNKDFYSNKEFTEIRNRINAEILRRGGFAWLNPLSSPKVGCDRTPPLSVPDSDQVRIPVDDLTYTINESSEGSIVPTRNIHYPKHGENPAGQAYSETGPEPSTSAALLTVDEMKNFIVGLSRINDINLFYGRDEKAGTAFRDPNGIEDLLSRAEQDKLHIQARTGYTRVDPYTGEIVTFPDSEDVFPTTDVFDFQLNDGELSLDGSSQASNDLSIEGLNLVLDDNGNPGDDVLSNYIFDLAEDGTIGLRIKGYQFIPSGEHDGDEFVSASGLGPTQFFDDYGASAGDGDYHPYNPAGTPVVTRKYEHLADDRSVEAVYTNEFGGTHSSNSNPRNPEDHGEYVMITPVGVGYPIFQGAPTTCQNVCTGLCNVSCDEMCSESCTETCTMRCGQACTSTCGNLCSGCSSLCYTSCKTKCENNTGYACVDSGAKTLSIDTSTGTPKAVTTYHNCSGCSYSCQFYPNKKTTCWDAGCVGKCFTSCSSGCLESCMGGCIANDKEGPSDYKTGKGKGCSAACTLNCIGSCSGVCEGLCTDTCFGSCTQQCSDNCDNTSSRSCTDCTGSCKMNCSATSCTALCSDACSSECTTCVNTCGFQCGSCSTMCAESCENACTYECSSNCANSCSENCTQSCTDSCGGCSNLCYSCVGMCVGICAYKCKNGCSSCTNSCIYWCDNTCSQECFSNCFNTCLSTCNDSCTTGMKSDTTNTSGPENPPTSQGYHTPNPSDRDEEQESFRLR